MMYTRIVGFKKPHIIAFFKKKNFPENFPENPLKKIRREKVVLIGSCLVSLDSYGCQDIQSEDDQTRF